MIRRSVMGKVIAGLFVGVFVGALSYELLKKSKLADKVSGGFQAAKNALKEGYQSATRPAS